LDEPDDVISNHNGFKIVCKASGSLPLTFQWKKNGIPIEKVNIWKTITKIGDNGEMLHVKMPDPTADGNYQCFVNNEAGGTFSRKMPVKITCKLIEMMMMMKMMIMVAWCS